MDSQYKQLIALVQASPYVMDALQAAHSLGLAHWCIGAGAIRNRVWDALHGYRQACALNDIDLVYFDPDCLDSQQEQRLQAALQLSHPAYPWEVSNQARVHLWYADYFGYAVAPLTSLEEAVASWPEYATAVGVYLDDAGQLHIIAPYGLDDLLQMRVRHNPVRASRAIYAARLASKAYQERWPRVEIVD